MGNTTANKVLVSFKRLYRQLDGKAAAEKDGDLTLCGDAHAFEKTAA